MTCVNFLCGLFRQLLLSSQYTWSTDWTWFDQEHLRKKLWGCERDLTISRGLVPNFENHLVSLVWNLLKCFNINIQSEGTNWTETYPSLKALGFRVQTGTRVVFPGFFLGSNTGQMISKLLGSQQLVHNVGFLGKEFKYIFLVCHWQSNINHVQYSDDFYYLLLSKLQSGSWFMSYRWQANSSFADVTTQYFRFQPIFSLDICKVSKMLYA